MSELDGLLGVQEIADLLHVERATVWRWRMRDRLPEPDQTISETPIWRLKTIIEWAEQTGRMRDGKPVVRRSAANN